MAKQIRNGKKIRSHIDELLVHATAAQRLAQHLAKRLSAKTARDLFDSILNEMVCVQASLEEIDSLMDDAADSLGE